MENTPKDNTLTKYTIWRGDYKHLSILYINLADIPEHQVINLNQKDLLIFYQFTLKH